jgi:hypothetical protein
MPYVRTACICPDGRAATKACLPNGQSYAPCECDAVIAVTQPTPPPPPPPPPPSVIVGGRSAPMIPGTGVPTDPTAAAGGQAAPPPIATTPPPTTTAGAGGSTPTAPTAGGAADAAITDALRQSCVDTINMYRATEMIAPMKRATPDQELCSDKGAKIDGDSGKAHGSAGMCKGLGGQDTCPGWPVGGLGGGATLEASMQMCLKQMWDEGMPPVSRAECQKDYQGCFLKYGHYLNMSDTNNKTASCGFYKMTDGKWWMNQDFGY